MTKIKILRITHVHYRHPDLEKADAFLLDFGLEPVERLNDRIYYRGFGPDPYCYLAEISKSGQREFGGGAWLVESYGDLERASKLPGASVVTAAEGPGGGSAVTLQDPNGQAVKLIHGQEEVVASDRPSKIQTNTPLEKNREGSFHRFQPGTSKVYKVGHYGFVVPATKFHQTREWYLSNFNFAITDSVYNPRNGDDELSFLHVDRGEDFMDHHVRQSFLHATISCIDAGYNKHISHLQGVFFTSAFDSKSAHIHHSSFEVHDMDSQLLGHDWLKSQGWTNCWGVGRHILGSQIFDYW